MSNKRRSIPLFLLAGLLFGVKTYIVYRFLFHIELGNMLQEFILVGNPLVASIIFFGISVWFKNAKKKRRFIRDSTSIGTLIIVYTFSFYIDLDNMLQEFILVVSAFVLSIISFGISVWFKNPKKQRRFILYSSLIRRLIIYFNLIFYRSLTDFLTIPQLLQTSN